MSGLTVEQRQIRANLIQRGLKDCWACKKIKPLNQFGIQRWTNKPSTLKAFCIKCCSQRTAEYLRGDPEARRKAEWRKKRRFFALKLLLTERADGHCECCGDPCAKLVMDHDHRVSQNRVTARSVRGLVCPTCNQAIGYVEWLENHPTRTERIKGFLASPPGAPPFTRKTP